MTRIVLDAVANPYVDLGVLDDALGMHFMDYKRYGSRIIVLKFADQKGIQNHIVHVAIEADCNYSPEKEWEPFISEIDTLNIEDALQSGTVNRQEVIELMHRLFDDESFESLAQVAEMLAKFDSGELK